MSNIGTNEWNTAHGRYVFSVTFRSAEYSMTVMVSTIGYYRGLDTLRDAVNDYAETLVAAHGDQPVIILSGPEDIKDLKLYLKYPRLGLSVSEWLESMITSFKLIKFEKTEVKAGPNDLVDYSVRRVISVALNKDMSKVTYETRLVEDLHIDSMDKMAILIDLEDAFEIDINDNDAEKVVTVGDACELIKRIIDERYNVSVIPDE